MRHSAAEVFCCHFFRRNGFDNCRTGNKHLAGVLHHIDEVGQSRRVHGAASARSHDYGNLGNNAGCQSVFVEDFAISCQSVNRFLNTSAAGIVDANDRSSHFQGQIQHFTDFSGMHFTQRTAFAGEILSKCIHQAAINRAVAGNNAFGGNFFRLHAKVYATMPYKLIQFHKAFGVEKEFNALTGRHLTGSMLLFNAFCAAGLHDFGLIGFQFLDFFLNSSHRTPPVDSRNDLFALGQFHQHTAGRFRMYEGDAGSTGTIAWFFVNHTNTLLF